MKSITEERESPRATTGLEKDSSKHGSTVASRNVTTSDRQDRTPDAWRVYAEDRLRHFACGGR
ncbi:MAG: hypothetical protein QM770_06565 [Tepidisphaeraceae bacterium]